MAALNRTEDQLLVTMAWDKNGNLCTNGTRVLEYDDENQLIRVTEPSSWKSEFTYDGKMHLRIRKEYLWIASAWVQNAEVRYVYDGNLVIQERDQFNIPKVAYTRGIDLSGSLQGAGGIGGLLARTDQGCGTPIHAYYHADGNGNITCLVASNQMVMARYVYDPFGSTLSASGPLADANLYRFSSKELHPASGLVYYLYRFYEPNLQRWLSRDPLGENGFESLRGRSTRLLITQLSLYSFVQNATPNALDRFGLDAGGPFHPPDYVSVGCDPSDNCTKLRGKLWLLQKMLGSHTGWDRTPGGAGRHAIEIGDLWRAFAKCQKYMKDNNCKDPPPPTVWDKVVCKVPGSEETWQNIQTGCVAVSGAAICGAIIVGTGGLALAPALAL
jgi:RHS repeat-associated protein